MKPDDRYLSLLDAIGDDSQVPPGAFAAAVFLTYSLNLQFYEQLVAQRLGQIGCSNVLIMADAAGYAETLEVGRRTISGAGTRYVCMPVLHRGGRVQHAKMLLLAGRRFARLFIGSGNLTPHGYGRNLELFSRFEFDVQQPDLEARYALQAAWRLIERLGDGQQVPSAARSQLHHLRSEAAWLTGNTPEPVDSRVWHNVDFPIWQQLQEWRKAHGLMGKLRRLQALSPYYDEDYDGDENALFKAVQELRPAALQVYLDRSLTNLHGQELRDHWNQPETTLRVMELVVSKTPAEKRRERRPVHAKALLGLEAGGAWLLSGSANLTAPALLRSWSQSGNLELVTLHWSTDPSAFDYLLADEHLSIQEVSPETITATEEEPSERRKEPAEPRALIDLSAEGTTIRGRLSTPPPDWPASARLRLLRPDTTWPIVAGSAGKFSVELREPLKDAEAARVEAGDWTTGYRWIDQPEALQRFGQRSYHQHITAQLESVDSAGKLFEQLLDFLWHRVDLAAATEDGQPVRTGKRNRRSNKISQQELEPLPPDYPFIVNEHVTREIYERVGQQVPYDRSMDSLRDLLSLVLLRLTTPAHGSESEDPSTEEEHISEEVEVQEKRRVQEVERLREYLLRYCKKYGQRLTDAEFVKKQGARRLFQNHFTLGNVLLEFVRRAEEFTSEDFYTCLWRIWAPLAWPEVAGMDRSPALRTLIEAEGRENVAELWREQGMSPLYAEMMELGLGLPPEWSQGLHAADDAQVRVYMAARQLNERIAGSLGESILRLEAIDIAFADDGGEVSDDELEARAHQLSSLLRRMSAYEPPTVERLRPLLEWIALSARKQVSSPQARALLRAIATAGLQAQVAEYRQKPRPVYPLVGDEDACPHCGLQVTIAKRAALMRGELVLCPDTEDAWLYWRPAPPEKMV